MPPLLKQAFFNNYEPLSMKNQFTLISVCVFMISCDSVGDKNYSNLMNIKKGMSVSEANTIMLTKPKLIEPAFWNDSLFVQYYESPVGASDDLGIVFNKDSIVVEIKNGD